MTERGADIAARFLLDTDIVSDLVRHPRGRVRQHIIRIGVGYVCTSIVVAAELRYGVARHGSTRLSAQVEAVLSTLDVMPLELPADIIYGELRMRLERAGQIIGANDLLIAAHALTASCTLITDNDGEFSRIEELTVENWLR